MAKNKPKQQNGEVKTKIPEEIVKGKSFWWILLGLFFITIAAYYQGFSPDKSFTNWDDPGYVVEQPLVRSLSADTIQLQFKPETQVMLNYHPLTMLTLAYNYAQAGLDIQPYFKTNLFLHIANTLLVFWLIFLWSKSNRVVAGFCALLFAIHPMHVESVAWISERKDVLYTFFFLFSLISYWFYITKNKVVWLLVTFVFFLASCWSKAMAVPLPMVLLLVDLYVRRPFQLKTILEKIPFFAVALWFGWNAVQIQANGAIASYETFSTFHRLLFAAYGFLQYWWKFFVPIDLSAFYPYPTFDAEKNLPFVFYTAPLLVLVLLGGGALLIWKKSKEQLRLYLLGMGFFIFMIALVLQFISVGSAIMADRYTYVPYIGAAFILFSIGEHWAQKMNKHAVFMAFSGVFFVFLFYQTFNRVAVWTNSDTLWSDVIAKYPYVIEQNGNIVTVKKTGVEVAYKNRGNYYREQGRMDLAFKDYEVLYAARVSDPLIYSNMGNMFAIEGKFDRSLECYGLALERDSTSFDVYLNRGITFGKMGNHEAAAKDFQKALTLRPNNEMALTNLCGEWINLRNWKMAIETANTLIQNYPSVHFGYFYRGTAAINLGEYQKGVDDLIQAGSINPNYPYTWFNAAIACKAMGNTEKMNLYKEKAKALGMEVNL
jgi:protein O-mannosyl-transferase